jgi:NAD(P)-dependent dehydrogenase (short-subunit alcohol dehydrogenase family)
VSRRVALVTDTTMHLGPDLARELARRDHDLVVGEPHEGLVSELEGMGGAVESVSGVGDLADPNSIQTLVARAIDRFGRIDSACIRTGTIVAGSVFHADVETLRSQVADNLESVFHALQAVLPPMIEAGSGQMLIVTSASGEKPVPTAPLYSATRAAANMLVRNTALSIADKGVTLNAVGTNYLDYPNFRAATGTDDPVVRARYEAQVPLGRLGQPEEIAHFCAALLDGKSNFQTGQFFSLSGGWNAQ